MDRSLSHNGLPLRVQEDFETGLSDFSPFPSLVRRWRLAEAQSIKDPVRRRAAYCEARSCLKCPRSDISPYRGVSAWIPSDAASQSLDVAVSVNGGDYEED